MGNSLICPIRQRGSDCRHEQRVQQVVSIFFFVLVLRSDRWRSSSGGIGVATIDDVSAEICI